MISNARQAVLLMGPTGAGKSELAVRLARELPFEIVSTDSALVYRGMDIGTAKPDATARAAVPHHLIDIRDPAASYSAGEFLKDSTAAMEEIWRRGRCPLFVGGTMLYFHALTSGIAPMPTSEPSIRARINARAAAAGWPAIHAELAAVDPAAALRIHANDAQRIQRALEVYVITGHPISVLQRACVSVLQGVQVLELIIAPADRKSHQRKLADRFASMLDAGFVAEVRSLQARSDLGAEHPSMRAVGYRELWRYVTGLTTLDEASDRVLAATRQLAKRQLTWLRARERAVWFDADQPGLTQAILKTLTNNGIAR